MAAAEAAAHQVTMADVVVAVAVAVAVHAFLTEGSKIWEKCTR